jgi:anti-sigma factor (TIGR02949 family)
MPAPIVFPPDCEKVVRALWDYLDGTLGEPEVAEIDAHMAACEYCRAHAEFERRLIDEIRVIRRQHNDPAELRSRIQAAIRSAGEASR